MKRPRWWKTALVVLVVLGALFVDGFGAAYQYVSSRGTDPKLGCTEVSLRASGLTVATGSIVVSDAATKNVVPDPGPASSLAATWPATWAYNISRGGGQEIATLPGKALANAAAEAHVTRTGDGYHLAVAIGKGSANTKTFWVSCNATVAVAALPSPSAPASASPNAAGSSATASPSSSSPSPTASPSPSATPAGGSATNSGPDPGGQFWVDSLGNPSILGAAWTPILHKGLDLVGGSELTLVICHGANDPAGSTCRNGLGNGDYQRAQVETLPIIQQRVNGLGVSEATVQPAGTDKIVVQLPGVSLDEAVKTIGTTAKLHFATAVSGAAAAGDPTVAADQKNLFDANQFGNTLYYPTGYHWKFDEALQASNVTQASASFDQNGQPAVVINFDSKGAAEWSKITTAAEAQTPGSPQNRVAIFLDNKVITAPNVQQASSSNTQITGGFTTDTATALAGQINAGALPADISTIQSTQVSATLGQQTVKQSLIAGGVGLLIVVFFMIGYYRFPGVLAVVALLCYMAIVVAVYKLMPVTVTLAGLAGFVLSVGMAVDANVLIFERTRDELRHGRAAGIAVDTGFNRAFPAIRDSNVSTLIACTVLWGLGNDVIKGFALTLGVGVVISFFSAVVITRTLFSWALRRKFGRNPRLYTEIHDEYASAPPRGRFDIVKSRNAYFLASLLIIIPGILAILFWGFRLGLDFAGGNRIDAHLRTPATISQIQSTVDSVGADLQPQIQAESDNHFSIRTLPAPISRVQQITSALDAKYGFVTDSKTNRADVQVDTVGPTIAADTVRNAVVLVLMSSLLIAAYLFFAFRRQQQISAWRFSVCTFFKLLHDVFVLVGLWAILGHFSDLGQVDSLFITAVLTSVAFSIHDTIVVFDRVRENLRFGPRLSFDQLINLSTVQTMTRSLNTALTVVFVLLALELFGGASIRGFVLALLIGIVTGTYSSIFNASTLLVAWKSLDKHREATQPPRGSRRRAA